MAIPKNASISSQIGQLIEEFSGAFGYLNTSADLFPADLWDSFCSQYCNVKHEHKTPDQYSDYHGAGTLV